MQCDILCRTNQINREMFHYLVQYLTQMNIEGILPALHIEIDEGVNLFDIRSTRPSGHQSASLKPTVNN